MQLESVTKS